MLLMPVDSVIGGFDCKWERFTAHTLLTQQLALINMCT